jgi:hypothetical protein
VFVFADRDYQFRREQFEQSITEFEESVQQSHRRLEMMEEELGIRHEQLDINWFNAISQRYSLLSSAAQKPDKVDASVHGRAIATVAFSEPFARIAENNLRQKLLADGLQGFELISRMNALMRGDDGQLDPMAIYNNLGDPVLQREFNRQVAETSRSVSRGLSNADVRGQDFDFMPGISAMPPELQRMFLSPGEQEASGLPVFTTQDAANAPDGTQFTSKLGGVWVKQGGQAIPLDEEAMRIAEQHNQ